MQPTLNRRQVLALGTLPLLQLLPGITYASIVRELEGEVWVNNQHAHLDTPIRLGDVVRTGKGGRIIFVIEKDVYKLKAYSSLKLEKHSGVTAQINLLTGALLAVFGKGKRRRIQTKNTTIGIRGTGVYVQVNKAETYFCTCYGQTDVTEHHHGKTFEIDTQYHEALIVPHDEHKQVIESAEMLYHDDAELVELEALVGRKPPARFFK